MIEQRTRPRGFLLCLVSILLASILLVSVVAKTRNRPAREDETEHLTWLVRNADLIFVGRIFNVGPPPDRWGGYVFPVYQSIDYEIEEILKGETECKGIRTQHPVVRGSPQADLQKPQLHPDIFKQDNRLIVFAKKNCILCNEALGIRRYSDKNRDQVVQILSKSSPQGDEPESIEEKNSMR